MIKFKRSSNKIMHKLIFGLPLMIITCFAVHPVQAGMPGKAVFSSTLQLTEFEGYYHADTDPNLYLQIMVKDNKLVLKQLWDNREITFDQKSDLYFYNDQRSFPLRFTKDTKGEITQVLAFERDTWIKDKNYKPVVKKEITLSATQMQSFAGKYKLAKEGDDAFLQFTVKGNSIEVKELWSEKVYTIVPESELLFFAKDGYFPVQFSRDKDGNISQALIFNKDTWVKLKD